MAVMKAQLRQCPRRGPVLFLFIMPNDAQDGDTSDRPSEYWAPVQPASSALPILQQLRWPLVPKRRLLVERVAVFTNQAFALGQALSFLFRADLLPFLPDRTI